MSSREHPKHDQAEALASGPSARSAVPGESPAREGPPVLVGSFREPTPGRFSLHGEPTRGRAGGPGYLWSAGPASLRKPTPPELRVAPSRGIEGSEDRLRSPAYDH